MSILAFTTPLVELLCGIPLPAAYVRIHSFSIDTEIENLHARAHFKVYKDEAAYLASKPPINRGELPMPFKARHIGNETQAGVDAVVGSLGGTGPTVTARIVSIVENVLGAENVTWDE